MVGIKTNRSNTRLFLFYDPMRVTCLAQEHNAVPRPGLKPGMLDPAESNTLFQAIGNRRL